MTYKKTKLESTIVYDDKIAQSFHKMAYFEAQVSHLRNIEEIEKNRAETTGKRDMRITEIREKYQKLGMKTEIKIFGVLDKIKSRVTKSILNGENLPTHENLINIIAHPYVLLAAYRTVRTNKGAKSPAFPIPESEFNKLNKEQQQLYILLFNLPDGLDFTTLCEISALVKSAKYPWGCSRLIWIPKPGTDKKRPITIPSFADRMVQEAIRMVLEAIYEPVFIRSNCSFGFRASNGVHEAIVKATDPRCSNGLHMALEGDIESAYPNLDRGILMDILGERIKDNKLLKLIRQRLHLRLFDVAKKGYEQTLIGIPQGGSDSPYLWNIYLMGFDDYIQKDIQQYFDELNLKRLESKGNGKQGQMKTNLRNPVYKPYAQLQRKSAAIQKQINEYRDKLKSMQNLGRADFKPLFEKIKEKRVILSKKLKTRSVDPQRAMLKFNYIRYADDWLILTNAPKNILQIIKKRIANWLLINRKAILSESKTLSTDLRKGKAHFLGFELKNTRTRRITMTKQGLKRTAGWSIIASPDRQRLINRLHMKGYCTKTGFPKEIPWLSTFEPYTIIQRFNSVITGLANFYAEFVRFPSSLNRWMYIIRYSCLKTLAQKYKTNISGVFKLFGEKVTARIRGKYQGEILEKSVSLIDDKEAIKKALKLKRYKMISKKLLEADRGNIFNNPKKEKGRTPRVMDANFLDRIKWVNFRTQASLDMPCIICGCDITEMHHLRHVRKTSYNKIDKKDNFEKAMYLRNRKQAPLCRNCHLNKLHSGRLCLAESLKDLVGEIYPRRLMELDVIEEVVFDVKAQELGKFNKLNDTRALDSEAKISINPDAYSPNHQGLADKLKRKGWKKVG